VKLLDNPAAVVPTAMNIGITHARGEFIVRADAHSCYPQNYIETCIDLLNTTGADNVGGPAITVPSDSTFSAKLVAAILSNRFGVGNSQFRTSTQAGFVDTVPFGSFRKSLFARVGMFNEALGRNEDNEFNFRIRKAGGKVYLSPALAFKYYGCSSFFKLLQQTVRSAKWHLFTTRNIPGAMAMRHLIPAAFVLGIFGLSALALVSKASLLALAAVLAVYFLAACYFAFCNASETTLGVTLALPFAFSIFHATYGLAILAGAVYLLHPPKLRPTK
jgi:GT2 family glycosyltransferase